MVTLLVLLTVGGSYQTVVASVRDDSIRVSGFVVSEGDTLPVGGATVAAIRNGQFIADVQANASGGYELDVVSQGRSFHLMFYEQRYGLLYLTNLSDRRDSGISVLLEELPADGGEMGVQPAQRQLCALLLLGFATSGGEGLPEELAGEMRRLIGRLRVPDAVEEALVKVRVIWGVEGTGVGLRQ